MSANSYPSPVSSNSGDTPSGTPPRRPQDRLERRNSQRSLQNAAASLESAFQRLEQVRASLVQLSDRLADSNPTQPSSRTPIAPPHDAILLAGANVDDPHDRILPEEEQINVVSEFQDSLRRAVQAQTSLTQLVEQSVAHRQAHPPHHPVPQVRLPHRPLPPDSRAPRYLDLAGDDGVTSLGRRVAARTSTTNSTQSNPLPDTRLPSPFVSLARARMEAGMVIMNQHTIVEDAITAAQRASQTGDLSELRRLSQLNNQLRMSVPTAPLDWRQDIRRRRPARAESRTTTPSSVRTTGTLPAEPGPPATGLSMLSNLPLNNLETPPPLSAISQPPGQRPLLFDEPESYWTPSAQDLMEVGDLIVDDVPFGRNYVVRRHMNSEGMERVQSIPFEWPELESQWVGSGDVDAAEYQASRRRMLYNFQERTQRPLPPAPSAATGSTATRRRGWARLDPDGNEIPSDEEEELERHRTEYRIRASNSQGRTSSSSIQAPSRGTVLDSVTRINDSILQPRRTQPEPVDFRANSSPFKVNPLPTPLEDMIPSKDVIPDDNIVIIVPRHASFAGR